MSLLPIHIAFMIGSECAMAAGILVARFFRSRNWWLKTHRLLNIIAVGLALCGILVAFIMVQASGGPHLRVGHAIIGASTLVLVLVMPALGFLIFRSKAKTRTLTLKRIHRWTGRLTILAMAGTAIAGFYLIGFIPR